MGLFGNRRNREERALDLANKVASGKGFYGRMTKAIVGEQDFGRLQEAIGTYNNGIDVQAMLAAGMPTVPAVVVSIQDARSMINADPVVDLVVQLRDESRISLRTAVSKLRIPRSGEQVWLIADPRLPGAYLYAGVAEA